MTHIFTHFVLLYFFTSKKFHCFRCSKLKVVSWFFFKYNCYIYVISYIYVFLIFFHVSLILRFRFSATYLSLLFRFILFFYFLFLLLFPLIDAVNRQNAMIWQKFVMLWQEFCKFEICKFCDALFKQEL